MIGKIIQHRPRWRHINKVYDEQGVCVSWDVEQPRQDDDGWSKPMLVVRHEEGWSTLLGQLQDKPDASCWIAVPLEETMGWLEGLKITNCNLSEMRVVRLLEVNNA